MRKPRPFARSGRPAPRKGCTPNKLELRFIEEVLRPGMGVTWSEWGFERLTLKLADMTRYTPDFYVILTDGELVFYETKGHWEEDARAKIKMAAETFPFRFIAARREKGCWVYEQFAPAGYKERALP